MEYNLVIAVLCLIRMLSALDNGLARVPQRGFSTWNVYPQKGINESTCYHYMDGIVKTGLHLPPFNFTYFIVDEPCFIGRDSNGILVENSTTWPKGLKSFGKALNSVGMKLGIYTCNGPTTCGGCVASQDHEHDDMATFAEWGADYIKVDSCSHNRSEPQTARQLWERYPAAINATGRPMLYSIVCNCAPGRGKDPPWAWGQNVANSWRTNIDIQIGWQAVHSIVDCQSRLAGAINRTGGPGQFSGPGHWNDMDMLIIGTAKNKLISRPLTISEARAHMSMWVILKSPLLISADLSLSFAKPFIPILANPEVIAVSADPLGIEATRMNGSSIGEIYVGQMTSGYAAVFFNRNSHPANFTLVFSDITPIQKNTSPIKIKARDLWLRNDLGEFINQFTTSVPSHDAVMISFVEV